MSLWIQNIVVLLIVAGCVAYLVKCGRRTLNAKCGQAGSCCSHRKAPAPPRESAHEKIVFLPVEMLRKSK